MSAIALPLLLVACAGAPPAAAPASTAGPGVVMLRELLPMPGLGRSRRIRLYLPPDYASSGKRYPVLYMHDAQTLFDAATSNSGTEWRVDEILDARHAAGKPGVIVVGIDTSERRIVELNPWPDRYYGQPEGKQYVAFIVDVVKPLIDREYRTLPGRAHTGMMGASMGGLISDYAIHAYPQVFGMAGIFSPAYTTADPYRMLAGQPLAPDARVYFAVGESETDAMVEGTRRMVRLVKKAGHPAHLVAYKGIAGGRHDSATWSGEFAAAVEWLIDAAPCRSPGPACP